MDHDPLAALDAAIEKAAMRFADGSVRRVSMRQRRNIRMQNASDKEVRGGSRQLKAPEYRSRGSAPNTVRAPLGGGTPRGAKRDFMQRAFFRRGNSKLTSLRDKSPTGHYNRNSRKRSLRSYRELVGKAKPKTLYVYRPVENAADIIAWAQSQGFKTTQPAEKLHVTLAYSKTPLNWAMLHDDYHLEPSDYARSCGCEVVSRSDDNSKRRKIEGGVREVKALGADGAIVLAFESDSLTRRWMDFKSAGAVWKFPSFTPHLTISYFGEGVDLSKVHPYAGDIILGEECWEEVKENGQTEAIAAEKKVTKAIEAIDQRLAAVEKAVAKPASEAA